MKELACEMCGSTNVVKQDGLFICQSCGTKYSIEEAKKIMEGTVEVTGTVKVDSSSELENLYEIARRAKDSDNSENGLKYYDMVLVKDPNSWEAQFYVVYFRAMSCKIMEIGLSAQSVYNSFDSVLTLIKNNVTNEQEQMQTIREVVDRSSYISTLLYNGAVNHYEDIDFQVRNQFTQEYSFYAGESVAIHYVLGDKLIEIFGDKYKNMAADLYKQGINLTSAHYSKFGGDVSGLVSVYSEKIREIDGSYNPPELKFDSGCYVATSIYGSYDCPEVWTLRRFRDNTLAKSIPGRMFIKFYYAVSPTVVKYFGETKVFKDFFKPRLDKLVSKLQEEGVESSFYIDE